MRTHYAIKICSSSNYVVDSGARLMLWFDSY